MVVWKFPKIYEGYPDEVSNNKGDGVPTSHLLSPNKASSIRLDYIQLSCWPQGSHGNHQITHTVVRIYCIENNLFLIKGERNAEISLYLTLYHVDI